jgi:hypothetical protein
MASDHTGQPDEPGEDEHGPLSAGYANSRDHLRHARTRLETVLAQNLGIGAAAEEGSAVVFGAPGVPGRSDLEAMGTRDRGGGEPL